MPPNAVAARPPFYYTLAGMNKRWTGLFLVARLARLVRLASLLLAVQSFVPVATDGPGSNGANTDGASSDGAAPVDDTASLTDGITADHAAVVPARHSARLPHAAYVSRFHSLHLATAPPAFVEVIHVSTCPAHLRSGPNTVSERGPPVLL
ncbi:MAG: hypothetical protein JWN44_643 [Myxococcales bacterium]|nr:hypothetical protein [Myxococcales bacterium]